ncbi:MAG: Na/Pi cotransporter family protein [Oscillospiraceae bacterium]|jgi:phosphate:Na+ symporter|nr:Na/Pi cotransporter family protein [Oscillospiraceae bacterium]
MSGTDIILIAVQAFGGVALFIYGMLMLSRGLEKVSGGKLEKILSGLTNNIFKSVALGAAVTAAIQSSGATTVIIVGMVNAGILKLSSAIGVIMGANIGTTVTGQILRLGDLENSANVGFALKLLTPTYLAPIIAITGLVIYMLSKSDMKKNVGEALVGLGILFTGMLTMSGAVAPMAELEAFRKLFSALSNPFLGIIAGAAVTALLQSSSASIGILQAISSTGILKFSAAFPIIMGQNIGSCVTSLISAVGANKNAKRAAAVHLYFNVIGTVAFLTVVYTIKAVIGFPAWDDPIYMGGIANFHTFFNVAVTLCFLPFTKLLEKLACITIRDKSSTEEEHGSEEITFSALDERFLKSPSLAIQQAQNTVVTMGRVALQNFTGMRKLFSKDEFSDKLVSRLNDNEEALDRMEDRLNAYLVKITECTLTDYENRRVTELLHLTSEFERIGDYAMNLIENAEKLHGLDVTFSDGALRELSVISDAVQEIIGMAVDTVKNNDIGLAFKIEPLEETVDFLNETLKARHIERLKNGECVVESGVNFLDLLINLERISDHCSNIAVYVIGAQKNKSVLNRHEYIQAQHKGSDKEYIDLTEQYMAKYIV